MTDITPLEFFLAFYGERVEPGQLVLWSIIRRSGKKHTDWCYTPLQAARLVQQYRNTRDVFFGVALQDKDQVLRQARRRWPRASPNRVRGGEDTVTALPALWADIDVAGPGHASKTLPPDRAAALKLLAAVSRPPSILIWTGGGFHAYWLLKEPWVLETEEERREARRLVARVQWALQREAETEGWSLDHTADLSRVMRVPGTFNHKRAQRRPVTVEQFPLAGAEVDRRYTPGDFDDLPAAPERRRRRRPWKEGGKGSAAAGGGGGNAEPTPADFQPVWNSCSWLRHCYDDRAVLPEPEWYAMLSIVGRSEVRDGDQRTDGRALAHRFSRGHPGYAPHLTDDKLTQALRARSGPRTCHHIAYQRGAWHQHCSRCESWGRVSSPLLLGRAEGSGSPGLDGGSGSPPLEKGELEGDSPGREASSCRGGGRPEIVITTREKEVNDRALAVLAAAEPNLFERGGLLVEVVHARGGDPSQNPSCAEAAPSANRAPSANPTNLLSSQNPPLSREGVGEGWERGPGGEGAGAGKTPAGASAVTHPAGAPLARPLQEARFQELLAQHCAFVIPRSNRDGVEMRPAHPPRWCIRALLARGRWPELPYLDGLVEGPVLRADGSVLQEPGYDPATCLVYAPSTAFLPVPERPTGCQQDDALTLLREVVCDFPFEAEVHFAAWLSSLLTPLGRPAFDGPSPLNLIDANTRGAGKSLLADVVSVILTGRPAARMSHTRDEDEVRKAITGLALEGTRLVLIDNVEGVFGSATLDRALTAWTWRDRLLGSNEHVELPLEMTWYATGNNVALRADTPRRCLHVRLESPDERPEERTVFRHPQLVAWVRRHRGRILPAALTLLRAYVTAGRPAQRLPGMGSYESWSDVVRSAIVWLGLPDPAATRGDLELAAGSGLGVLSALLEGLDELLADLGGEATARRMVAALAAEDNSDRFTALRAALRELFPRRKPGELPTARELGYRLRSYTGRIVDGRSVVQAKKSTKGVTWALRRTAGRPPSD